MEVRIIKTCHGLRTLLLYRGALLPEDNDPNEVTHIQVVERLTLKEFSQRYILIAAPINR